MSTTTTLFLHVHGTNGEHETFASLADAGAWLRQQGYTGGHGAEASDWSDEELADMAQQQGSRLPSAYWRLQWSLKSLAEQASAALGDDGSRWTTDDGESFDDVMRRMSASMERSSDGRRARYQFADGSAIVDAGGAWDIEGDTPFSWAHA